MSEGEREEGEVLSSEDEGDVGEGERGEEGNRGEGTHALGNGDKIDESVSNEDGPVTVGAKRPAPDCDSPNAKVPYLYVQQHSFTLCKMYVNYVCINMFMCVGITHIRSSYILTYTGRQIRFLCS